jgi:hypothetical protein
VTIKDVAMHGFATAGVISSVFYANVAFAGPYTDDLSKCLVKATSADDQIIFMQWMFSAISLHPTVSGLTTITAEQRCIREEGGDAVRSVDECRLSPTNNRRGQV